jgi:peptidoglycan/LPS O-acetylase OafA/YrhL
MFGTYRTVLALAVVLHHLIAIPVVGHYAVHGFFILSGYLMTYIMNRTYGYSLTGIRSFALNRFLRLYPAYWAILAASLIAILWFGEENSIQYRAFIFIPNSIAEWSQNISLIFYDLFPDKVSPRISPPTWALTIEIAFYLLIAVGISKSKRLTLAWFIVSAVYMLCTHIFHLDYRYRYSIVFSGTLPFSIGALAYHFYDSIKKHVPYQHATKLIPALFVAFILNSAVAALSEQAGFGKGVFLCFYLNYLINASIIILLIDGRMPWVSKSLDKAIGDYSYPLYLMHWQVGFVASMVLWGSPINGFNTEGIVALALALPICFIACWLVIHCVDEPIERLRKRIKTAAKAPDVNAALVPPL